MKESLVLKTIFNVKPSFMYNAWLDSNIHSEMTGSEAECTKVVSDTFSAWNGYISGKNVELIENKKIIQTWRTTEFDEADEDSMLVIEFTETPDGTTELLLTHTNIPEGQTQYEQGWLDHYFLPIDNYIKTLNQS